MAVTRVTHSTRGFEAINYALNGKPHVSNKYIPHRVLTSSGVNCTVYDCRQQMNAVWKRYGINRPTRRCRRQVQRLIQSFDPRQLNYKKPKDATKANRIGRKLAFKLYPYRQSIVITQADNRHHIIHNHIITNMLDFRTGKSMTGKQTSWQRIQVVSDKVIKNYGLNPIANKNMTKTKNDQSIPVSNIHRTNAEYHIRKRRKYSWVRDVRSRVKRSLNKDKSTNWKTFIQNCRNRGVKVDPFRKHKGSIRKDKDGHPLFKKHTSFIFKDKKGNNRHIRDRKLGSAFAPEFVTRQFQKNIVKQHEKAQRQKAQYKRHVISHKRRIAKRQRAFQRHNIKIQAIAEQRKLELKKGKIRKLRQRKIKYEQQLLQRQRSRRITQIQSAIKKSSPIVDQSTTEIQRHPTAKKVQSTIARSSKVINLSTQEGQRYQRQPTFNRKVAKKPFRRLSARFKRYASSIKKNGGLRSIFTRYLPKIHQIWQNVRRRAKRITNQIKKLNSKFKPDYSRQSFDIDDYGHIQPTGDHLELYLQQAIAFKGKKTNSIIIATEPYYRRDMSKYFGGRHVSYRRFRHPHSCQWITSKGFNNILERSNQLPIDISKLNNNLNMENKKFVVLINGKQSIRKPFAFKANVFQNNTTRMFNTKSVRPSPYPFSYEHELLLNEQWHHKHDFNLARSAYWKSYSNLYYKQNGKYPNPHERGYLSDFQTLVVSIIRSKEQQHNQQFLTPKNKIERNINNVVNANPNNANNYTYPWYIRGTDVPNGHGSREL